jgi:hypothetical protein
MLVFLGALLLVLSCDELIAHWRCCTVCRNVQTYIEAVTTDKAVALIGLYRQEEEQKEYINWALCVRIRYRSRISCI